MLWHSKKYIPADQVKVTRIHAQLVAKHAHKFPEGMPRYYRALLYGNARFIVLRAHERDSAWGAKLMRQRMAKAAHKAIRAKGMQPCQAAREAVKRNKELERKARARGVTMEQFRVGSANLDGI